MTQDWKDLLSGLNLPSSPEINTQQDTLAPSKPETKTKKTVTMFYERKGRGGKEVTILADFKGVQNPEDIKTLASQLKQSLGCGGSVRDCEILIQGDRRQDLRKLLTAKGFEVNG